MIGRRRTLDTSITQKTTSDAGRNMYLPPFGINSAIAIQLLPSSPSEFPNAVSPWVSSPTMLVRPRFLLSSCTSAHTTTPSGSTCLYRPRYRCGDRLQWRRLCLGSRKHGPRVVDDPRSRLLLLRSLKEEERAFAPLSLGCGDRCYFFRGVWNSYPSLLPPVDGIYSPVVLLGLLARVRRV